MIVKIRHKENFELGTFLKIILGQNITSVTTRALGLIMKVI